MIEHADVEVKDEGNLLKDDYVVVDVVILWYVDEVG